MKGEGLIEVLLIEDDRLDARTVIRHLQAIEEPRFRPDWVTALQPGLDKLGKGEIDLVLLDLELPDAAGLEGLMRLRAAEPEIPLVVLTGARDMRLALRALHEGAQDFLVKEELTGPLPLLRSLRYAIERQRIEREQRSAEERLAQAQKLASLGVLSAGLAVGFQPLLGTILDDADEAIQELCSGPEGVNRVRRRLNRIRRSTLRVAEITDQLRDYAVSRPRLPGRVELGAFVREMSELLDLLGRPGVELAYELPLEAVEAGANRLQLHQLLVALVQNAVEAIDERGLVRISAELIEVDARTLAACQGSPEARPGRYAALSITDTGCGMDESTRRRAFEPFFTTKAAGRGLGLSAALGIARQCRARIGIQSRPAAGTRVTVFLPAS